MLLQPCRIFGMDAMRRAEVTRKTKETQVRAAVNLDGEGRAKVSTGIGFLDHMLEQLARHSAPDGMRCRRQTVNSNPSPGIYFIHQQEINIISKIVLVDKWLIKSRNACVPVKDFSQQKQTATDGQLNGY